MKNKVAQELSDAQNVFLHCFKNALCGGSNVNEIETAKSYEFWQELANLSAAHHVMPMIYEQVNKSAVKSTVDRSLMKEWKFKTVQSILRQEKNTACFLKIYQKLQEEGFHPLVVKGVILRNLYCNPEYRSSSDEDFWLPKEEYAGFEKVLLGEGFEKASSSNEEKMSFDCKRTGFHMEVHLVPFSSQFAFAKMNQAFEGCFERQKVVEIQGVQLHTLCDEDHMNYMIGHCFQHFATCGVGIRQIADLMKYAEAYGPGMDWDKVKAFAQKYNLLDFWKTMMAVARQYLGFSCEKANLPEKYCTVQQDLKELMQDILSGGIYGKSAGIERICGSQVVSAAIKEQNASTLTHIRKAIFLAPAQMQINYPWLKKRIYLLPAAWIMRGFRVLKKYRTQTILNSFGVASQRTQLAKKYHFI